MENYNGIAQNDKMTRDLIALFEGKVDRDVIESVAYECEYDFDKSATVLLEMSSDCVLMENTANGINTQPRCETVIREDNKIMKRKKPLKSANEAFEENLTRIIEMIKSGTKVLIILRGLPGSGKSHLAKEIVRNSIGPGEPKHYILSTDDFFSLNGRYNYNARFLTDAHSWNQQRSKELLRKGVSPLIIDNTNCMSWEMKPYFVWGVENTYVIEVLEPNTSWAFNDKLLGLRNSHNVPRRKIKEMMDRYDFSVTTQNLFQLFNVDYKHEKPPQKRNYPPLTDDEAIYISEDDEELVEFHPNDVDYVSLNTQPLNSERTPKNVSPPEENTYPNLHDWGVSEESLRSWNVVRNLPKDEPKIEVPKEKRPIRRVEVRDSETNTASADFAMLQKGFGGKIMIGRCREINPNWCLLNLPPNGVFDKSCMTDELGVEPVDHKHLFSLFESVPRSYVRDVYEKCGKNVFWAAELMLDNNKAFLNGCELENGTEEANDMEEDLEVDINVVEQGDNPDFFMITESSDEEPPKKSPKPSADERQAVKQQIEAGITINPTYYSNHILKLKKIDISDQPSTSNHQNASELETATAFIDQELEDVSDTEYDDLEEECDEMIELNLGDNVVGQLEDHFGDSDLGRRGYLPIVEIPKFFARQLHAFYLESIYRQMESQKNVMSSMIKEDEEFAKQLQEQEATMAATITDTPDLKRIMSEQVEQSKREKTNEQWKQMTPDDLAYKLTKQKLCKIFPEVEADVLYEILSSHNNCYKDTVETLLASGVRQNIDNFGTLMDPPISEITVTDMRSAHAKTQEDKTLMITNSSDTLRDEATKHQYKRQDLMNKAQTYSRNGMPEVAWFYSNLASQETHLFEMYNNLAVEQILQENFTKLQDFCTLDLHHLRVKEAITALDIYLDRNIMLLRAEKKKPYDSLMIITGRGKNSPGGIPKIRPKVKKRLNERHIGFEHLNPGLLKIRITVDSPLIDELF